MPPDIMLRLMIFLYGRFLPWVCCSSPRLLFRVVLLPYAMATTTPITTNHSIQHVTLKCQSKKRTKYLKIVLVLIN